MSRVSALRLCSFALCLLTGSVAHADAIVTLTGPDSNQGSIDLSTASASQYGGLVTDDGVTGYSLWGLLGGSTSATTTTNALGTTITYGGITTFTPTGDNSKNAILRYYLTVTNASGQTSVVSLGEIDPNFTGSLTSSPPTSDPVLLSANGSDVSLSFLGTDASGRDLGNVTSVELLAVPALPGPPATVSETTPLEVSGNVGDPGTYTAAQLASQFPVTEETVNGDNYTGVALWTLLDPDNSNIIDQYVIAAGADGYEMVLSLAELDPSLGGNAEDIVPYADTNGNFPGDGIARVILPGDESFAHGRWVSNLDELDVQAVPVPEPNSVILLLPPTIAILFVRRRRHTRNDAGGGAVSTPSK